MIKAIGKKLIVLPDNPERTKGVIELPDQSIERSSTGLVLSVGSKCDEAITVGSRVQFGRIVSTAIKDGESEVFILDESQVIALIE